MKAFLAFLATHRNELLARTLEHIELVALSLLAAVAIGVPLAVALRRNRTLAASFVGLASVVQTIPSIALLSLMLPLFGLGRNSAVAALFLYALLPVIRNTLVGLAGVPPAVVETARGMGMNGWQRWWQVQFPLALPVILAGVRIATVVAIGIATIGAKFSAGGLGVLLFEGIAQNRYDKIVGGSLVIALLALVLNRLLLAMEAYFDTDQRIRRIERRQQRSASAMAQVTS